MKMKVDLTEFNAAMRNYVKETKMTVAEAVDKKAIDLAFKANQESKRADKGTIQPKGSQLYHVLAATGATRHGKSVKGKGNKKIADKIASGRTSAVNYNKAIWLKLAADLGAAVKRLAKRSAKMDHVTGTKSKKGGVTDKPFALLEIGGLKGVEAKNMREQLEPALKRAMTTVIKDMRVYIERKIAERAKKYSGRKSGKK